tara:strand:+ start:4091 stop:4384 length:294 start_codon:yes stop_codon:yes gene_type:complete
MSLIGFIDKTPLFSTKQEAVDWGKQYDIKGYHSHIYLGRVGYMAGFTHKDITETSTSANIVTTPVTPIQPQVNTQQTAQAPQQTITPPSQSTGGGGY